MGGLCPVAGATDPLSLVDHALYSEGDPHAIWTAMRRASSVAWQQADSQLGFWSVVSHQHVAEVLREWSVFTSERGTFLDILGTDDPAGGNQMAVTDPPRHTEMRSPLQQALNLRVAHRQEDQVRRVVVDLLTPLADGGVHDFAKPMTALPMAVAGTLMGLPETDWGELTRLTTTCIAPDEPEHRHPRGRRYTLDRAHRQLFAYFQDSVRERQRRGGDDLISLLLEMQVDGRRMTQAEVVSNCYSMILGANVTTPHAPMFALEALAGSPGFSNWRERSDHDASGVEEALRWASPVSHSLRYANRDYRLGDVNISAGEAVVAWIGSANRDETVFENPFRFDQSRRPNKHLAFGAGPHYCVGHIVARLALRILFREMLDRFEHVTPSPGARRLRSNFVYGFSTFPVTTALRRKR